MKKEDYKFWNIAAGFIVLLSLVAVLGFANNGEVVITRNMTPNSDDVNSFRVDIKIIKGAASGFGMIKEYLPIGMRATVIETANARFSFEEQKVKFVWLETPDDPFFTVSYKVTPDINMTGTHTITGTWGYLHGLEYSMMALPECTVTLTGEKKLKEKKWNFFPSASITVAVDDAKVLVTDDNQAIGEIFVTSAPREESKTEEENKTSVLSPPIATGIKKENLFGLNGMVIDNEVILTWMVKGELEKGEYDVEISYDNNSFVSIGKVNTVPSPAEVYYSWRYRNPTEGTTWFRISRLTNKVSTLVCSPVSMDIHNNVATTINHSK